VRLSKYHLGLHIVFVPLGSFCLCEFANAASLIARHGQVLFRGLFNSSFHVADKVCGSIAGLAVQSWDSRWSIM
jgi:hypothetical protein